MFEFSVVYIKRVEDVLDLDDKIVYRAFDYESIFMIEGVINIVDVIDFDGVLTIINNAEKGQSFVVEILYGEYSGVFEDKNIDKLDFILDNLDYLVENKSLSKVDVKDIFIMKVGDDVDIVEKFE